MSAVNEKIGMAERILESSIKLFNAHGFHDVTMLQIAYDLGIAPGSVSYHYKKKRDILMALIPLVEQSLEGTMKPSEPMVPSYSVSVYQKIFQTLWRYRFFFTELTHLLAKDVDLQMKFISMQEGVLSFLEKLHEKRIEQGFMLAIEAPNSARLMSRNHWAVWMDWLRSEHIEHPHHHTLTNSMLRNGILRAFYIWRPYVTSHYAKLFLDELQNAHPAFEDESASSAPSATN